MPNDPLAPRTKGLVLHSEARYYDLLASMLTLGRDRAFRERLVELARVEPGEALLDVGCGTGTLALAAKRRVGATGTVVGIDASPEMIDRARRKAEREHAEVTFQPAVVEALPFPDASFDVVTSTLMLHHLPRPVREQCVREIRRVLRPGGRVLAVDFGTPPRERTGLLGRIHRHGAFSLRDITDLLRAADLRLVESGSVGVQDLQFALATVADARDADDAPAPVSRSLEPLSAPRWILPVAVVALVAVHALLLRGVSTRLALSAVGVVAVVGLIVALHGGLAHILKRRGS